MREHIAADEPFEMRELPAADAIEHFRAQGQDYKVELIEDLVRDEGAESVTLYRNGPFEDLCRGPHGPSTGRIGAFKLTSLAGAYWRGDETRQMLTRIYGTAFHDQKQLDAHLEQLELAKQRDHRRLGPELDLFMLRPEAPGMPFWLPNGSALLELMDGRGPRAAPQARLRGDQDARGPGRGALAPLRALGQLQGEHVLHRVRGTPLRPEADELPGRLRGLRLAAALLPRAAAAAGRVRQGLPKRARGRPARAAAGASVHPGRRARLLHRGAGHRRGGGHHRGDRRALRPLRVRGPSARALDTSGEVDRHRRAMGAGRVGAEEGPGQHGARLPAQPRRRRLLRAQDRLSRHRRPRAARGSSAPASSTSSCPSASTSPIPAPTTPNTAR